MSITHKQLVGGLEQVQLDLNRAVKQAGDRGDATTKDALQRSAQRIGSLRNEVEKSAQEIAPSRPSGQLQPISAPSAKLFFDSVADLEKRRVRLLAHFRHAEVVFLNTKKTGLPTPRDVLWILFQEAERTIANMPFEELQRVSKVKSLMPAARHSVQDAWELTLTRLNSEMSPYDSTTVRTSVSESDVEQMVDVMDLLRFVDGRDEKRLRRTFRAMARGCTTEQCGRIWDRSRIDFDRRAMHDIKQRVIAKILVGMDKHFGLVRTSRGFRRLTVREIERRARLQRREQEAGDGG